VCGIKTNGRQIAKPAHGLPIISCSHGIATVFNKPEIMPFAEIRHCLQIEWVAERVGDRNRPRLFGESRLQLCDVNVIGWNLNIHEHWNEIILKNRIYCGRKTSGNCYNFIAGLELSFLEQWGSQTCKRE